jgi:hypothetical protein
MDKQRRKDLVRGYHETPRPMGVYRVYCAATGHGVIGASRDLPSALNRQRAQLSLGGHPDKPLQEDWNQRGADAFVFEVLDTMEPGDDPSRDPSGDLEELAQMWRARLTFGADPSAAAPGRDEWDRG